jgi:predicted metal-binding membrane protein
MADATALERVLKRDRVITTLGLVLISALAWFYTIFGATGEIGMLTGGDAQMGMSAMAMPDMVMPWSTVDVIFMFIMWFVMMVAMMLPSASPTILLFAKVDRSQQRTLHPYIATLLFAAAYILVWAAFSLVATAVNWALHTQGLMTSMMGRTLPLWSGLLLIMAGIYQFTPLKGACLNKCRSPLAFLLSEWRDGNFGAFVMGLRHGTYCVLCCWALMALLFVLGVMNLLWVAVLSVFVLAEKIAPSGVWLSRASGVLLIGWGALLAYNG